MLLTVATIGAQTTVSGVVTDYQTRRPLSHVSVRTEGSDVHTVTNEDGRFTLKVTEIPKSLRLSHIGYKTRSVSLEGMALDQLQLSMVSSTVSGSSVPAHCSVK